jgi:hypothetical protein
MPSGDQRPHQGVARGTRGCVRRPGNTARGYVHDVRMRVGLREPTHGVRQLWCARLTAPRRPHQGLASRGTSHNWPLPHDPWRPHNAPCSACQLSNVTRLGRANGLPKCSNLPQPPASPRSSSRLSPVASTRATLASRFLERDDDVPSVRGSGLRVPTQRAPVAPRPRAPVPRVARVPRVACWPARAKRSEQGLEANLTVATTPRRGHHPAVGHHPASHQAQGAWGRNPGVGGRQPIACLLLPAHRETAQRQGYPARVQQSGAEAGPKRTISLQEQRLVFRAHRLNRPTPVEVRLTMPPFLMGYRD